MVKLSPGRFRHILELVSGPMLFHGTSMQIQDSPDAKFYRFYSFVFCIVHMVPLLVSKHAVRYNRMKRNEGALLISVIIFFLFFFLFFLRR